MSPTAVCLCGEQSRLFIPGPLFYFAFVYLCSSSYCVTWFRVVTSMNNQQVQQKYLWMSVSVMIARWHFILGAKPQKTWHDMQMNCTTKTDPVSKGLKRVSRHSHSYVHVGCFCHEGCKRWGRKSISLVFYKSPFFSSLLCFLTKPQWRNADPKRAICTDKTESAVILAALRGRTLAQKCSELNICTLYSEALMLSW